MEDEDVEWRDVPDYEGLYEVSSLGDVRHSPHGGNYGRRKAGKVLRAYRGKNGYQFVGLKAGPGQPTRMVGLGRIVARAFHGNSGPYGLVVQYRGGDKSDCRACNVFWGRPGDTFDAFHMRAARRAGAPMSQHLAMRVIRFAACLWERSDEDIARAMSRLPLDGGPYEEGMYLVSAGQVRAEREAKKYAIKDFKMRLDKMEPHAWRERWQYVQDGFYMGEDMVEGGVFTPGEIGSVREHTEPDPQPYVDGLSELTCAGCGGEFDTGDPMYTRMQSVRVGEKETDRKVTFGKVCYACAKRAGAKPKVLRRKKVKFDEFGEVPFDGGV